MNSYPRETVEFIPVTVTVDGVAVTSGVTFAVVADGVRPSTFSAATTLGGEIGVLITTPTIGRYTIWAKVTASPEAVVINCGSYDVS